jgi:hypothetical protein
MVAFDGTPESLNKHNFDCTSFSVHADLDAFCHVSLAKHARVHFTGKLAALVTADDFGLAVFCNSLADHSGYPDACYYLVASMIVVRGIQ